MSSGLQERTDSFKQLLLTAQRRHLIGHLETTISGYEERIDRQQKLLDVILQPRIKVRGAAVFPADVQQLSVIKDELLPEQQESSRSQFQDLKDLFKQQLLTAPREDLTGLFETTISTYQREIDRQQKLLDVVLQPEIKLRRAVVPADVQQLLAIKKEVSPQQQDWSPSMDQEDPEPPHIKVEQEEIWITKFTFTPVPAKSEDEDEEKPQSSQLHQRLTEQMEAEADGEDCGGPEPSRNSYPGTHLTPDTDDKTEDHFELEIQVDNDDENTRGAQLGLNFLNDDRHNFCEELFSCSVCGKQFNKTSNLKRHMKTHTGEKPFSCSVCGKRFALKAHLQNHFRFHTGEKPFSCSVCGKRFAQNAHLQGHLRCHTGEKPFGCSVCGQRFALKTTLQNHFRCHTGEKPFSCSHCDKSFSRYAHLQSHLRTHTGDKPFHCSVCEERFTWRHQIKNHKCGAESSQLHELWTNLDKEDPEPPYVKEEQDGEQLQGPEKADITRFTFSPVPVKSEDDKEEKPQFSQLHERQTEQTKTDADGEDCGGPEPARNSHPDTNSQFSSDEKSSDSAETDVSDGDWEENREPQSSQLHQPQTKHMETEADGEDCGGPEPPRNSDSDTRLTPDTEDKTADDSEPERDECDKDWRNHDRKSFLCVVCGKTFKQKGNLTTHMRTHTGEKPFSCSFCSERFSQKSGLDYHSRIHTGNKPFSCSVCCKRFAHKAHLQNHFRCHTGENPFSCSVCGKQFKQNSNLKRHVRTHTGEKPYNCSLCNKSFLERAYLQVHMRTHTGEKPYSCNVCSESFTWRRQFKRHKCGSECSQLQGLEEADVIKFTFTPFPIKQEDDDDEEKPQFSPLHQRQTEQMKTEADGEDCGRPEPARNSHPDTHLQRDTDDRTDSEFWQETREWPSGLHSLKKDQISGSVNGCNSGQNT